MIRPSRSMKYGGPVEAHLPFSAGAVLIGTRGRLVEIPLLDRAAPVSVMSPTQADELQILCRWQAERRTSCISRLRQNPPFILRMPQDQRSDH